MNDLTYKQYFSICLLSIITINFMLIYYSSNSLISLITGFVLSNIIIFVFFCRDIKIVENNKFMNIILFVKLILVLSALVVICAYFSSNVLEYNRYTLIIGIIFASFYCGCNKSVFIVSRILYIIILLPLLLFLLFYIKVFDIKNISHNFVNGGKYIEYVIRFLCISLVCDIPLILNGTANINASKKQKFLPIIIAEIVIFVIYLCCVSKFQNSILEFKTPYLEFVFGNSYLENYITRLDGILIPLIFIANYVVVSLYFHILINNNNIFSKYTNLAIVIILAFVLTLFKNMLDISMTMIGVSSLLTFLFVFKRGRV